MSHQRRSAQDAQAIVAAARHLNQGGLVAMPTETVYGLAADGLNPDALAKVFAAKGRPSDHPLILHVAHIHQAQALSRAWPVAAQVLAEAFWPGPLTLVLPKAAQVPLAATGGQDTVAIRMPAHPAALRLLEVMGQQGGSGVLAAPSANRFGRLSPVRAQDVIEGLGPFLADDDLVLDGGQCTVGLESTIVDCSQMPPRILRPGGLSRGQIDHALHAAGLSLASSDQPEDGASTGQSRPRVSGSLAAHYAPTYALVLAPATGLLSAAEALHARRPAGRIMVWSFHRLQGLPDWLDQQLCPRTPEAYGRVLYAQLQDWQAAGYQGLVVEALPEGPDWEAAADRLKRAAADASQD